MLMNIKAILHIFLVCNFSFIQCMEIETFNDENYATRQSLRKAIEANDIKEVQSMLNNTIINMPSYNSMCSKKNCSSHRNHIYPLHIAMQKEEFYYTSHTREIVPQMVILLLQNGADPNKPYNNGITMPLHVAVKRNQPNIIKELLKQGAHKNSVDENGKTAYELAQEHGYTKDIINLLCPDTIKEKKQTIFIHRMKCIQSLIVLIAIFLYRY